MARDAEIRDAEIAAIAEVGRRTRRPTPRWLWIAAVLVGGICAFGFAVTMLAERAPAGHPPGQRVGPPGTGSPGGAPGAEIDRRPTVRSGLGVGIAIAAGAALAIALSVARQRRSHSSRNSP